MARTKVNKRGWPHPKRRRPLRLGRRLFWCMCLLTAAAAAGGIGYTFHSYLAGTEELHVRTIRISGAHVLEPELIIAESGVTTQDNVLFLDERIVAGRVKGIPYVKDCKVTRVFPDMVVIDVVERGGVATLMADNRFFSIDPDGVVLEEINPAELYAEPFITEVAGVGLVQVGDYIQSQALHAALKVLEAFRATDMSKEVTVAEIAAYDENDVRMYCDELPFEIRWGRREFDKQAQRLNILWAHENKAPDFKAYCDLRFGTDVACR